MVENSKIEWTDHTFNPWTGCQKVSPGCDNCYAESWAKRSGLVKWGPGETRRRTSAAYWQQPLKWNRNAKRDGVRRKVFCASLADVFDNEADPVWRAELWRLIALTPDLDWLLLTKRPQNIAKMLPLMPHEVSAWGDGWPNVWLGTTAENQEEANRRIPHLLAVPAVKRFLSCEPLLGPVDLISSDLPGGYNEILPLGSKWMDRLGIGEGEGQCIDWVICGGESGPRARPMYINWARALRDQCQHAGVPFFFKQWGEWAPNIQDRVTRVGKKAAGAMLDGREWREFPI